MSLRQECSLILALWLGTGSPAMAQHTQLKWTDVVRESAPGIAELKLLRETADALASVSPTFARMLATVKSAPRLIVFVRPGTRAEKLGQTHFYVTAGRTFGVMEINPYRLQPLLRVRAIAHELAHAVEIACLPSQGDTSSLKAILIDLAANNSGRTGLSTETRFPATIERIVLDEFQRFAAPSQRQELAWCDVMFGSGAPSVDQ
jgi:hypothetical protein